MPHECERRVIPPKPPKGVVDTNRLYVDEIATKEELNSFKEHIQALEKRIEALEGKETVNVHEFPSRYGIVL